MKYRIAITTPVFIDLEPIWQEARDKGADLEIKRFGRLSSTAEYIDALRDADGALISTLPLTDREVLEACPKLKAVSRLGVGVDSIDLNTATRLGVLACNVPGENTIEVAEHALSMLLAIVRRLPQSLSAVQDGAWGRESSSEDMRKLLLSVDRIAGKTIGIIGLGNIGKAFASRIRAFGPRRIVAYDEYVSQAHADGVGAEMVGLDELLSESDCITIHAPHTPETDKIINAETLSKMKPTAILINCARGKLVDEAALVDALRNGTIAYAGLDVTEQEPINPESPLIELPNAFVTPHFAGYSPVFMRECGRKQAENVTRILTGRPPHGLANPDVIKRIAEMRMQGGGRWAGVPEF